MSLVISLDCCESSFIDMLHLLLLFDVLDIVFTMMSLRMCVKCLFYLKSDGACNLVDIIFDKNEFL